MVGQFFLSILLLLLFAKQDDVLIIVVFGWRAAASDAINMIVLNGAARRQSPLPSSGAQALSATATAVASCALELSDCNRRIQTEAGEDRQPEIGASPTSPTSERAGARLPARGERRAADKRISDTQTVGSIAQRTNTQFQLRAS